MPFAQWIFLVACSTPEADTVHVPPAAPAVTPAAVAPVAAPEAPATALTAGAARKLNLNTATEAELATVPGAGPKMVHEFLEYRPYASIQQFRKEMGKYVEADKITGYEAYLYVPIDPSRADATTLQQIPGLDLAEAEILTKGRPYPDQAAFLAALAPLVTPAELEAGKGMLATP